MNSVLQDARTVRASYSRRLYDALDAAATTDGGFVLIRTATNDTSDDLYSYNSSGTLRATRLNVSGTLSGITSLQDGSIAVLNSPASWTAWVRMYDPMTLAHTGTFDYSSIPGDMAEFDIAGLRNGGVAVFGKRDTEYYVYAWNFPSDTAPMGIKLSDYGITGAGFKIAGDVFQTSDTTPPTTGTVTAPEVGQADAGQTSYQFTIQYLDNVAINVSTLDNHDVTVTGPGFMQDATLVSVSPTGNGTPRAATYQITPPGGAWDAADNGTYTIGLNANQVFDTSGNAVASNPSLATFEVTVGSDDLTLVQLVDGNLIIEDVVPVGKNDILVISLNGANVRIHDPGNELTAGAGVGSVDELIFHLPAAASNAFLEDDGAAENNLSQLRSANATFETTTFVNPTDSLMVNRGHADDTLTITDLPDFDRTLTIGSDANPFFQVTFDGALDLAAGHSLSVDAVTIVFAANSGVSTQGDGAIDLTATRNIAMVGGSSITAVHGGITLSANQKETASGGSFSGIDVDGGTIEATGTGTVTIRGRGGMVPAAINTASTYAAVGKSSAATAPRGW